MGLTSITNIPAIMRAKKWLDGAALMDRWFAGPPATMPHYTTPDTTTIEMDSWVLAFPRAKTVYDIMVRDKVWKSDKAKTVFASRLATMGATGGGCFDLSSKSVPDQHDLHVNFKSVPDGPLDDMEAALANFSIYVTPLIFDVTPQIGKLRVDLSKVGFHVMDSYDFNGHQVLGFWDETTNTVSTTPFWGGAEVDNGDFRDWRTANKKGGDFLVFSDVKEVNISPPDSFLV